MNIYVLRFVLTHTQTSGVVELKLFASEESLDYHYFRDKYIFSAIDIVHTLRLDNKDFMRGVDIMLVGLLGVNGMPQYRWIVAEAKFDSICQSIIAHVHEANAIIAESIQLSLKNCQ